jgi:hypothetical protein
MRGDAPANETTDNDVSISTSDFLLLWFRELGVYGTVWGNIWNWEGKICVQEISVINTSSKTLEDLQDIQKVQDIRWNQVNRMQRIKETESSTCILHALDNFGVHPTTITDKAVSKALWLGFEDPPENSSGYATRSLEYATSLFTRGVLVHWKTPVIEGEHQMKRLPPKRF